MPLALLGEDRAIAVEIDGWRVACARSAGEIQAFINRCPHSGWDLSVGEVRRGTIQCRLHGARFNLVTGKCVGEIYRPLTLLPHQIIDGWIEVILPAGTPGIP